jgi:hypothetical protein
MIRALTRASGLALGLAQILGGLITVAGGGSHRVSWSIILGAGVLALGGASVSIATSSARGCAPLALSQLVVCGVLVVALCHQWQDSRALGVDGVAVAVLGFCVLCSASVAFGTVLVWGPRPAPAAALVLTGVLAVGGIGVTAAGAAAEVSRIDCGRFHFDRGRWATSGVMGGIRMSRTIAECGTLEGRTRAEVRAMVGPVLETPRMDHAGMLEITYDDAGRVAAVRDTYPD